MSQSNAHSSRTIAIFAGLGGLYVFLRWLLFPLLPFLFALAITALAEPLVSRLQRLLHVRRSFAAAVVITAILLVAGSAVALLALRLIGELGDYIARLPQLVEQFPALWNTTLDHIALWYKDAPHFLRAALDTLAAYLTEQAPALVSSAGEGLIGWFSNLASKLPDVILFLITTVLALYFSSLHYPAILGFLKRQLPPVWQGKCRKLAHCCRSTLLKWLRAESFLILTTFLILLPAFLWLGFNYAFLSAVTIALVDALPVLGAGMVLIPWAAITALGGNGDRALLLVVLYAVVVLVHSLLEPRLLAGQAELPPITALLSMYLGFRFFGVSGMVLLPILLLLAKQLQDAGIIRIWQ